MYKKFTLITLFTFFTGSIYICNGRGVAGNIKLVLMRNNQYWFSSTSPYAPTLNFFLAYEYCRNLGLQLTTLETKDEIDAVTQYLISSPEGSIKQYWTSGNSLGADTWLWMSNGEQLNGTFLIENGIQQTQRRSIPNPGSKQCLTIKAASFRRAIFTPDDCEKPLPFICEQIRCLSYYYPTVQFPDPNESELENNLRSELINTNDTSSDSPPGIITVTTE